MLLRRHLAGSLVTLIVLAGFGALRAEDAAELKVKPDALGATKNVTVCGTTLLCGQPSEADFKAAKERGIDVILTLRGTDEIDWNEQAVAQQLGLDFKQVAFRAPETLTDEVFETTRKILNESAASEQSVMMHCGSANRVGAIWLVHRVLDHGISLEQATQEAKQVGLRMPEYEQRAIAYINSVDKMP